MSEMLSQLERTVTKRPLWILLRRVLPALRRHCSQEHAKKRHEQVPFSEGSEMRTEQARYTPSAKHCERELAICRPTAFISRNGNDQSKKCRQSTDPVLCKHRKILVVWITRGARPPIRRLILFGDVFRIGLSESAGADAKQPMVFE